MADLKISQLTGATTPLAGTEVLPIVQSGTTKQVSVANLTAGRSQTSNGIVQGSAGTGYNFTANTPAAGMTSQLLNWYEEGTATLTMTGSTAAPTTPVTATARYTRIGRQVTVSVNFDNKDTTGATGNLKLTGLPFAANSSAPGYYGSVIQDGFGTAVITGFTDAGTTDVRFYTSVGLGNVSVNAGAGKYLWLTLTYFV